MVKYSNSIRSKLGHLSHGLRPPHMHSGAGLVNNQVIAQIELGRRLFIAPIVDAHHLISMHKSA